MIISEVVWALMPSLKSFTLLLLLYSLLSTATGKVYYITPNQDDHNRFCTRSHEYRCQTLSQFSDNATQNFNSSVSLILLPGTHIFNAELKLAEIHKVELISNENSNGTTVFCGKSSGFNINSVLISGLDFRGCKFSISDVTKKLEIANNTFIGTEDSETPLWVSHSNVSILKSSFISNVIGSRHDTIVLPIYSKRGYSMETNTLLVGEAIYTREGSKIDISDSNFIGNIADLGGAIYAEQGSRIIISHSRFQGKRLCNGKPGSSGCKSATTKSNSTSSSSSPATNNTPLNDYGGAIFLHNSSLNANKCTFTESSALTGGALFAYMSNVYLSGCQFSNNTARYRHTDNVIVLNSLTNATDYVSGNEIHGCGGAFYTLHSDLTIDVSQFTNNNAHNCGVVIHSESGSVALNRCKFSHNRAGKHGGAVCASSSYLHVCDILFSRNVADDTGGAIYVYELREVIHRKVHKLLMIRPIMLGDRSQL